MNVKNNINDEEQIRVKKARELREMGINPYPARSVRTHTVALALKEPHDVEVTISGRLMSKRDIGKLTFCHLRDASGQMQIALKQDEMAEDMYQLFIKKIDSGDIVSVSGKRFTTHKGEESILVKDWTILNKALLPLPEKWHGLADIEI